MDCMTIEFIKDFETYWKKGDRLRTTSRFADDLIRGGYAKAMEAPNMNKMISKPEKIKGHNIPHYVG